MSVQSVGILTTDRDFVGHGEITQWQASWYPDETHAGYLSSPSFPNFDFSPFANGSMSIAASFTALDPENPPGPPPLPFRFFRGGGSRNPRPFVTPSPWNE